MLPPVLMGGAGVGEAVGDGDGLAEGDGAVVGEGVGDGFGVAVGAGGVVGPQAASESNRTSETRVASASQVVFQRVVIWVLLIGITTRFVVVAKGA